MEITLTAREVNFIKIMLDFHMDEFENMDALPSEWKELCRKFSVNPPQWLKDLV